MNGVFIHRGSYVQFSGPVINCPQRQLFTGLNSQKSNERARSGQGKFAQGEGICPALEGKEWEEENQTGRQWTCLWTTEGLFTDAETGKDPPEQIIGAERSGNFPKGLLSLTQIFCQ